MNTMEEKARTTGIHNHCRTCYRSQCMLKSSPPESCAVIACELHCGAQFHECKTSEHFLHCPEQKVACINHVNGCPSVLPRRYLGSHLERCPASVICCTMEWNRWPLYAAERQARIPFKLANTHAKGGQVDVALALRDQRMLTKAMQAPSTTKRALRSHLTSRFPAVPINVRHTESANPLQLAEPGSSSPEETEQPAQPAMMKEPQIVQLLEASKRASETLTAALSLVTEKKTDNKGSEICEAEISENAREMQSNNVPPGVEEIISSNNEIEAKSDGLGTWSCCARHAQPEGVWINTAIPSECRTPHSIPEPPPPPPGVNLQEVLALDINVEQITRYQGKPKSMYTFLCAQPFRRDEYSWHFVNVHSEIHGGLNGWIEHRCPLAHYGCTYSQRRLHPAGPGSEVVFSPLLESFGVCPWPHSSDGADITEESTQPKGNDSSGVEPGKQQGKELVSLLVLPFEVLCYMTRFLDGYSICNLSLTCTLLRDVCCSLLKDRGIVIQEWEPIKKDGRQCWQIAYKRWLFSTAFTPIVHWGFNDQSQHMSDHLRGCPYYRTSCEQEGFKRPIQLPSSLEIADQDPEVVKALQRMYPDVDLALLTQPPALEAKVPQQEDSEADVEIVVYGGLDKLVLPQEDFSSWAHGTNTARSDRFWYK